MADPAAAPESLLARGEAAGGPAPLDRFDEAAAWSALQPAEQAAIGAAAVALAVAWQAEDLAGRDFLGGQDLRLARAAEAADLLLADRLADAVAEGLGAHGLLPRRPAVPAALGPVCVICGCSEADACLDDAGCPCAWVMRDERAGLCTACAEGADG